jgi:hypothetical protein
MFWVREASRETGVFWRLAKTRYRENGSVITEKIVVTAAIGEDV